MAQLLRKGAGQDAGEEELEGEPQTPGDDGGRENKANGPESACAVQAAPDGIEGAGK
jgi:hypothetical protein